jgi:hypothetical protein
MDRASVELDKPGSSGLVAQVRWTDNDLKQPGVPAEALDGCLDETVPICRCDVSDGTLHDKHGNAKVLTIWILDRTICTTHVDRFPEHVVLGFACHPNIEYISVTVPQPINDVLLLGPMIKGNIQLNVSITHFVEPTHSYGLVKRLPKPAIYISLIDAPTDVLKRTPQHFADIGRASERNSRPHPERETAPFNRGREGRKAVIKELENLQDRDRASGRLGLVGHA